MAVGCYEIPLFDTARLRARGLVSADDAAPVRLALTARLGLLAPAHATGPDRHCTCGFTSHTAGPEQAPTTRHRQEAAAELVTQLGVTYTAAVPATR